MPDLPDPDSPDALFDRTLDHLHKVLCAPRTTMPELSNPKVPKVASTEPTATCQGCGLPIYRLADGTWNLVYREWDNTRICWPNNASDHQPATSPPGGPPA
jgi:hypothetical protein